MDDYVLFWFLKPLYFAPGCILIEVMVTVESTHSLFWNRL